MRGLLKPNIATLFGPIQQLGFVPLDIDAALKFWVEVMGVGPFFRLAHLPLVSVQYRGQPIELDVTAYNAYWGDMQIELVCQHNEGPSLFRDWLQSGREGVNHVRVEVSDLERARETVLAVGGSSLLEAECPGMGGFIYFDMNGPGPYVEASCLNSSLHGLFSYMKRASQEWDGLDPIREPPAPSEWI